MYLPSIIALITFRIISFEINLHTDTQFSFFKTNMLHKLMILFHTFFYDYISLNAFLVKIGSDSQIVLLFFQKE